MTSHDGIRKFKHVFIHKDSLESEVAKRFRQIFPPSHIEIVESAPFAPQAQLSAREFDESKKSLYLTPYRGRFFRRCPGAKPGLACCNYFVLNLGLQCDMNCSYCYLQSFLNTRVLTIYSNIEDAIEELRVFEREKDFPLRVGTGEVIDSLSLDPLTLYSHKLISFFSEFPSWTLEFKTKSNHVKQLLELPHGGNVIISWSINPSYIVEREEHETASFKERLEAARLCLKKGYQIAFHIDPIIYHERWRENYAHLVDEVTSNFSPSDIKVISLGALRFQPEQRHIMRERFGWQSLVTRAEMFVGKDGKLRYDQRLREEMFKFILDRFKSNSNKWNVFLCMETPESWLHAFSEKPFQTDGLKDLYRAIPAELRQSV